MLERKWIYLISTVAGVLALSGICYFAFFHEFKSEPRIPQVSGTSTAAGKSAATGTPESQLIPKKKLAELSESELNEHFFKGLANMDDFSGSILEAFAAGKNEQAQRIFTSGKQAMVPDTKKTRELVQKLVSRSTQENSASLISALKLMEDQKDRGFALKFAFQQGKPELFKTLLEEEDLVSTGPIFQDDASDKLLTIFDIVIAGKSEERKIFLPILLSNEKTQIIFTLPDKFAQAVAIDDVDVEYVKNLANMQRCSDKEFKVAFSGLISLCYKTEDTKEEENLLTAIKSLVADPRTKELIKIPADLMSEFTNKKKFDLAHAVRELEVRDWTKTMTRTATRVSTVLAPISSILSIGKVATLGATALAAYMGAV